MPDDYASHRRFHMYAVAGEGAGANDPGALTDAEAAKAVVAYVWPEFAEVRLFPRDDFERYATPFEHDFSTLCSGYLRCAAPIVDKTGEVIMYVGWFDCTWFRMPSDMLDAFEASDDWRDTTALSTIWKWQIFISRAEPGPGMSDPMQVPEMSYLLLTTTDGTAMKMLDKHDTVGDMSSFQPGDLLAGWIAGLIRRLGLAALEYLLAEETITELGTSALVGRVSLDEQEIHLTRILARRPELRALMAMRTLQGDDLLRETLTSLKGWGKLYGKVIEEKSAEEMVRVTTSTNLITLQPPGTRSQLWINKALLSQSTAREFYEEVTHELTADALGWSGEAGPETLSFVGERFTEENNAQYYLEQVIKSGRSPRDVIDAFSRLVQ